MPATLPLTAEQIKANQEHPAIGQWVSGDEFSVKVPQTNRRFRDIGGRTVEYVYVSNKKLVMRVADHRSAQIVCNTEYKPEHGYANSVESEKGSKTLLLTVKLPELKN